MSHQAALYSRSSYASERENRVHDAKFPTLIVGDPATPADGRPWPTASGVDRIAGRIEEGQTTSIYGYAVASQAECQISADGQDLALG